MEALGNKENFEEDQVALRKKLEAFKAQRQELAKTSYLPAFVAGTPVKYGPPPISSIFTPSDARQNSISVSSSAKAVPRTNTLANCGGNSANHQIQNLRLKLNALSEKMAIQTPSKSLSVQIAETAETPTFSSKSQIPCSPAIVEQGLKNLTLRLEQSKRSLAVSSIKQESVVMDTKLRLDQASKIPQKFLQSDKVDNVPMNDEAVPLPGLNKDICLAEIGLFSTPRDATPVDSDSEVDNITPPRLSQAATRQVVDWNDDDDIWDSTTPKSVFLGDEVEDVTELRRAQRLATQATPIKIKPEDGRSPAYSMRDFYADQIAGRLEKLSLSQINSDYCTPPNARVTLKARMEEESKKMGSVTIIAPISIPKKDRDHYGVEKMLTPVRRAARHMTEEEWQNEDGSGIEEMLEKHGFAFIPNPALIRGKK